MDGLGHRFVRFSHRQWIVRPPPPFGRCGDAGRLGHCTETIARSRATSARTAWRHSWPRCARRQMSSGGNSVPGRRLRGTGTTARPRRIGVPRSVITGHLSVRRPPTACQALPASTHLHVSASLSSSPPSLSLSLVSSLAVSSFLLVRSRVCQDPSFLGHECECMFARSLITGCRPGQ